MDKDGRVVGAISRYHLFHYEKKKFILVDHNEAMQSVRDLEFGEVVEIVDHHRMGGIETVTPIYINHHISNYQRILQAFFLVLLLTIRCACSHQQPQLLIMRW